MGGLGWRRGWQHWAQGLALTVGEAGLRPNDLVQLGGWRDTVQLDHLLYQRETVSGTANKKTQIEFVASMKK